MAPDITPKHLETYRKLAETAPDGIKDVMLNLCQMVAKFRETPESKLKGPPVSFMSVGGMRSTITAPLEQAEIKRIWDHVPDEDEIALYGKRFDALPNGDLRNAAFHLLWFANELTKDREPLTREKVFDKKELEAIDAAQIKRLGAAPITIKPV